MSILNILTDKYNTEMDYEQQDIKRYALKIWDYVHSICNENEEKVLKLRFKEALTRAKIGKFCGISIERTRQIEQQGFKRLRYNSDFRKWAKDFDYVCDLSYHYGFSSWLYNQQSAVELAVEIKDREYSRLQKEAKISNEAIQKVINALLN